MNICIYCGSKTGYSELIKKDVELFCDLISRAGFNLVYGGSNIGMMGFVAKIFRQDSREIIGVRPTMYLQNEAGIKNYSELIFTESMTDRKIKMLQLSDVIIALPGGIGTLDEITEAHCLTSIGQIKAFVGILNSQNYYSPLLDLYNNMRAFGYTSKKNEENLLIESDPKKLVNSILEYFTQ